VKTIVTKAQALLFCILFVLFVPRAEAQTALACLPKQLGSTGSEYLTGTVDGYGWFGWTCMVNGAPRVYGFVWEPSYQIQHPDTAGLTTANQVFRAYYSLNVGQCTSLGCGTARLAMRAMLLP
jgi:hypothetical protein